MEGTAQRRVPLVVVATRQGAAALVGCLRAQGAVVYQTRTPEGCLRVATAVRPDMLVLPRGFPRRLAHLLQQHPMSAGARIVWFERRAGVLSVDTDALLNELAQIAVHPAPLEHPARERSLASSDAGHIAPALPTLEADSPGAIPL